MNDDPRSVSPITEHTNANIELVRATVKPRYSDIRQSDKLDIRPKKSGTRTLKYNLMYFNLDI